MKEALALPVFPGQCEMTPEGYDEVAEGVLHQRRAVVALGKRICGQCFIQEECRDFGLATEQNYGMWGGLTPAELRRFSENGGDAA